MPSTDQNNKTNKSPAAVKLAKRLSAGSLKADLRKKSSTRRNQQAQASDVQHALGRPGRNDLRPDLACVEKPVNALKPSSTRARVTKPEQLERVIASIKQFGLVMPVLVDGSETIIAGHVIWEAAVKLGLETISCVPIEHLDEGEAETLALALNRTGETGSWNIELLGERMIALESSGIDLNSTGFTLPEIDQIVLAGTNDEQEGDEEAASEEMGDKPAIVRAGDLFELGAHRLLCGDALDAVSFETLLGDHLANCVISDPPFNCPIAGFVSGLGKHKHEDFSEAVGELSDNEFQAFLATYLRHCKAFTSPGAVIFAFMDWRQIEKLLLAGEEAELARKNIAVWNKGSGGMGSLYRSAHEFVAVFCNGDAPETNNIELGRHGRDRTNVWSYPGANKPGTTAADALKDHPTPKNVAMIEDAILDVTARGDVVLDPFLGSGTTLIAAETTGRFCAGIELDPIYAARAIRRWERLSGKRAVHLESGMTLEELTASRLEHGEKSDG